jgi:hypothetical protein
MDWLEQELRESLNRKDPPPGFEERVRRRTRLRDLEKPFTGQAKTPAPPWRLATAAAVMIAVVAGGVGYRQHQGEVARQQVMQAFRIAGGSLNHIQAHVREAQR